MNLTDVDDNTIRASQASGISLRDYTNKFIKAHEVDRELLSLENPEIVVAAFVYNGGEGAVTSGPIVRQVLEAYFSLKAIDIARTD